MIWSARETAHVISARTQAPDERPAEKAASTGDQDFHRLHFLAAQHANVSLEIFALWRISTGNPG